MTFMVPASMAFRAAGAAYVPGVERAPSLARGLRLLALLGREGSCTLERLARLGGWPKSSTHRLLHVLADHGAVARDGAGGRWRALVGMVPRGPDDLALCRRWSGSIADAAVATGCPVELYRFAGGTHVMIDRADPPRVQNVVPIARVGYLRPTDEADAVTVTAWAAGVAMPPSIRRVGPHGPEPWPHAERLSAIDTCRRDGMAVDALPNPNHVRRAAIGLRLAGTYVGALAVACAGTPPMQQLRRLAALLRRRNGDG